MVIWRWNPKSIGQGSSKFDSQLFHRNSLGLYDLKPDINCLAYVAPSATVVGEVFVGPNANLWNNTVVKADLNAVAISAHSNVGPNTVICTVSSLETGLPSVTIIGKIISDLKYLNLRRGNFHREELHNCERRYC